MRILRPTLPEPSDQVIQNLTIGDTPLGLSFEPWQDYGVNWQGERCLMGEWKTSKMPEIPVPRAMIGWFPDFAQASQIGPMAIQGGIVGMIPIGKQPVPPKQIDPAIAALYSQVSQDSNGELYGLDVMMSSQQAPAFDRVLTAVPMADPMPLLNPRREVKDSGLLKVLTAATLPETFGLKIYETQQSYQVFTLTGTTTDGAGAALGNCRVIAYQTGWQYAGNAPVIIAETTSDGSGNFSMLLRNIDYQLTAYKPGSPDLAGITKNNVTPVAATTIYLRDPTIPISPGASSGMSRSRVANA
jgi:hypothetical protein